MLRGLSIEQQKNILLSNELKQLALFEPKVMNHDKLRKNNYDPTDIPKDLQEKAQKEHDKLFKAYKRINYIKENVQLIEPLIKKLAQLLYVIRSNIKHGEKTPKGPDLKKAERDKNVCKITKPLLNLIFENIFDFPMNRLAVYGTLLPGEVNHETISGIDGQWIDGKIAGRKEIKNGFPTFIWALNEEILNIKIFISELLPNEYERLDRFEGDLYERIWVPVQHNGIAHICNIYSCNATG